MAAQIIWTCRRFSKLSLKDWAQDKSGMPVLARLPTHTINSQGQSKIMTTYEEEKTALLQWRSKVNDKRTGDQEELRNSPLFSLSVRHNIDNSTNKAKIFPQYGLLGYDLENVDEDGDIEPILFNVDAPHSTFICGSQGGGKSYTLSAVLENCLLKNKTVNHLALPIAGLVFHYDLNSTLANETATLCSLEIKVRVLASAANLVEIRRRYSALEGANNHLTVEALLFRDSQLDANSMKKLMAFSDQEGSVPLYMEIIEHELRQMKKASKPFNFKAFRTKLEDDKNFNPAQKSMMKQRFDLLQEFMDSRQKTTNANMLDLQPGTLTIVDLSDTFVGPATVCSLFDICLGLVLQQPKAVAKIIALDEAHKYLNKSDAAATFTEHLLSTIRTQRHNGTRVVISTQEPTLSPSLLDLCNTSIIHHFNSPAWFAAIEGHLGGASSMTTTEHGRAELFKRILGLKLGESLVFSPSSFVGSDEDGMPRKLGSGVLSLQTRLRMGMDIGMSDMASKGLV
ncbi:hypothetical protein LTR78_006116 [Recurvomyces mirabilis]|uniref:P-loop containing nucleoside triphosphate hydrolase protein n=1 Tax=Recurvomyces mirabilis TaxID=574656 RepID=A0AAE1C0G0_9PEZI|nr:hypothetical protein LTR78_006116 [Recurvomyces mirabilis]KAK5151959.1 hypothetical protein LTS14_008733 [Recurvomyces mirabilis]